MGVQILNAEAGLMTIRLTGKLSYPELAEAHKEAAAILSAQGKMRVLVVADAFTGWEREGDWGNLSFQNENDRYISRIALVGDKQWETLALLFAGQGVRSVPVAFFDLGELAKARLWLASET